jgi:hypothetical protein
LEGGHAEIWEKALSQTFGAKFFGPVSVQLMVDPGVVFIF